MTKKMYVCAMFKMDIETENITSLKGILESLEAEVNAKTGISCSVSIEHIAGFDKGDPVEDELALELYSGF